MMGCQLKDLPSHSMLPKLFRNLPQRGLNANNGVLYKLHLFFYCHPCTDDGNKVYELAWIGRSFMMIMIVRSNLVVVAHLEKELTGITISSIWMYCY